MRKMLNFGCEMEFYFKVAVTCTLVQQLLYEPLHYLKLSLIGQVLLYWSIGSISFYTFGLIIEKGIKPNTNLATKLNARVKQVKKQPFPSFTARGIILGEFKSLIAAVVILYLAPEAHRWNNLYVNFSWFFMRIVVADFCFYVAHWLLHKKFLLKFHLKHHEFSDSSSFVAGYKSLIEYVIVSITDLLPIFIFGYDITQLCAWSIIGNAYNLEGHSSLSLFFIPSDFHDLHHSCFKGNYGIQGFWDRVFNTLNTTTKKQGFMFPMSLFEKFVLKTAPENRSANNPTAPERS